MRSTTQRLLFEQAGGAAENDLLAMIVLLAFGLLNSPI
jgi:hypothetical protein